MKFALISHNVPPSGTGQALVIYRMLRELDPKQYCLISPERHDAIKPADGPAQRLPCRYYHLPPSYRFNRGYRWGIRSLRESVNVQIAVVDYRCRIADIVRREKCDAIVACTGDVTLLPAGYLASRATGVPFYAYIFDHYSYREWEDPVNAFWARRFEPFITKGAAGVIVPNEILRDDLRERFGVEATVIHNSFDISPYETTVEARKPSGEVNIVYTGAVYEAHYGAFRNLMAAIQKLDHLRVRVHLYTNQSEDTLQRENVRGPIVLHRQQSMTEMPQVQMNADILFLALAFDSPYPDLVKTSATTKLGEYLASRRPVLVHAPRDSFISWYFRKHECGVVVDEDDPARLAEGIELILNDAPLCQRLIANAQERARTDFNIEASRAAFFRVLGLVEDQDAHLDRVSTGSDSDLVQSK
jgi:glycosyltransferase involved in cell wall biosynthesis